MWKFDVVERSQIIEIVVGAAAPALAVDTRVLLSKGLRKIVRIIMTPIAMATFKINSRSGQA